LRGGDPEAIGRLSYSGGTTGKPKAIMASGRCGSAMLNILMSEWEWPAEVRQLVCSPLSHGGGAVFMPTMIRRGSLVVLPGFDPTAVLEAIQKHRITCVLLVPTMIYALLDHPHFDEYDLSSLEVIYYGASSISPTRLQEAIRRFGPIFFQFYGQAEAPMSVTVMKRSEHKVDDLNRLASCGRPVPWVRVALLDDKCEPVPDGEPGEICVRGPLLMSGYLNKPEQTAEAFEGGWLHTGDVAVRDPDGFLRIVDRKKDMIVSGGFNVFPREVEDVLSSHPAVAGAAVIGVPHDKWGEAVKAIVVLRKGMSVSEAELIALVRDRKGVVQAPKAIEFVDSIPLSGLGKPDKKAVCALYGKG
jgi:fatty-acyl-CoA synthase